MSKALNSTIYHTLNSSKTKEAHKFSTSDRFPKTIQSPCQKSSYNLNTSSAFFSASWKKDKQLGYEKRFADLQRQLRRQSCSPSPLTYKLRDQISLNKSMARSNDTHELSTFGNEKRMVLKTSDAPGPGKYETNLYNPQVKLSYTMRSRVNKDEHWNKVGPGQYNINMNTSFSTKNSSILGQTNKSKFGKQKRFIFYDNKCPGPNAYQKSKLIQPTSKYVQAQKYSFGRDDKMKRIKSEIPGPGTYNKFSQFYEGQFSTYSAR